MRKLNFGEDADGRYKALGVGERTSKKVSRIKMTDGSSFKRRTANQYGDAEGGNEYVETRSNRSDSYNLGGTADSADKGADIGGTLGSSMMKRGGGVGNLSSNAQKVLDRMAKAKVNRYKVYDFFMMSMISFLYSDIAGSNHSSLPCG